MSTVADWLFHASLVDWEIRLVYAAAIPQTLFVLGYGFLNPWWRSAVGRALWTKALSLALLLDLTVFAEIFGYDYPLREQITLGIVALIAAGAWMQFLAWTASKYRVVEDPHDSFGSSRGDEH